MVEGNYLEELIKQMQKDINGVKGELMTINQHGSKQSIKSLKRESISKVMESNKSLKKESQL